MTHIFNRVRDGYYTNTLPYEGKKKSPEIYNAYMAEEARTVSEFKKDCLEELGLTFHPKAGLLFQKSWERRHASGLYEVWAVMQDLAELVE